MCLRFDASFFELFCVLVTDGQCWQKRVQGNNREKGIANQGSNQRSLEKDLWTNNTSKSRDTCTKYLHKGIRDWIVNYRGRFGNLQTSRRIRVGLAASDPRHDSQCEVLISLHVDSKHGYKAWTPSFAIISRRGEQKKEAAEQQTAVAYYDAVSSTYITTP